ncbi:hypothetical protein [uncultured Brevundimonas sp.]|uniref:hypothetical protein n=1 Tax=uncultured Brevundimonas sp. TaxID=213418 RepID=UPI00260759EE|nr:hypothetical protein [uncultured Brevundimonas sp.]
MARAHKVKAAKAPEKQDLPAAKGFEIIYSQQDSDFVTGRAYSNPRFFTTPRHGVSKVYIVGDWPNIREAYEALGVEVEQLDKAPEPEITAPPLSEELAKTIQETFD